MAAIHGIIDTRHGGTSTFSSDGIIKKGRWTVAADASFYKISGDNDSLMERLLESWLKKGVDCVRDLYGDFAFVIHNNETGEIFCARDHFGVRPFFYCFFNNQFIFGSLLKSVIDSLPSTRLRNDYFLDSLVTSKESKDLTPFEDIYRLKPGHYLHCKNGKCEIFQFWHLNPEKRIMLRTENEYIEMFREKLVNAVTMRCKGITRVGTELSGGLDSSAVTGIAAVYCYDNHICLNAYSNAFPKSAEMDFKDEREFIDKMSVFAQLNPKYIDYLSKPLVKLLHYVTELQGCYIQQNFNMLCDALYNAVGNDKTKVLLSGFGGDEMVSARTSVQWNELMRNREWSVIRQELFHNGVTPDSLGKLTMLPFIYLKSFVKKKGGYTSGVFTKELLDKRFSNLPLKSDFSATNDLRKRLGDQFLREKRDNLVMRQIDKIMHPHLPQRLEYCYTAASHYGVEYRYPLLDVDLIDTYLAFPPWLKHHHGINRYVFREAIKGFVPEEIRLRNDKLGSTIPQTYYSLVTEREEILGLISAASKSSFLREIFDFEKFPEWYEKLVKRDPNDRNYLMPGAFYTYLMILLYYKDTWQ